MLEPLASLTILNNTVAPCKEGPFCSNGPSHIMQSRCPDCRLSQNAYLGATRHYWKPISHTYHHPVLEKEKRDGKRAKALERQAAKKAKDPTRQARLRAAERAERKTNAEIIKSTRNSGRVNKDGDHLLNGNVTLDTKLQSKNENPIVHLHELDKVRQDSVRAGRLLGALVLRNKNGRGVVVIDERDISKLIRG